MQQSKPDKIESKEKIATAMRITHAVLAQQAQPFVRKLHLQNQIFTENGIEEESLFSQIKLKFIRERLTDRWGMVFIDFDDTIYNATECRRANEYRYLYNGTSLLNWKKILTCLRNSGIRTVLFLPNLTIGPEDGLAQLKVFNNLKDFFSDVLFTADLAPKGDIIQYIWQYITQTLSLALPKNNLLYISDDIDQVQEAETFQIQTLLSLPGSGHLGEAPYILALRAYALYSKRALFSARFAAAGIHKRLPLPTSNTPTHTALLRPPVFPPITSLPFAREEDDRSDSDIDEMKPVFVKAMQGPPQPTSPPPTQLALMLGKVLGCFKYPADS